MIKRITSALMWFPLVLIILLVRNKYIVDICLAFIAYLALNEYFNAAGLKYRYKKNDEKIYYILSKYGSLEKARKNAYRIHLNHSKDKPSDSESCTTVYRFFDEVDKRLKELE